MSTVIVKHLGIRGDRGEDAQDGAGVDDVRGSLIASPTTKTLRPNKLLSAVNWTRDDEGAFTDRYGGQIFVPGDEIRHRLAYSNDFDETLGWADINGIWTRNTTNEPDPLGGNSASKITFDNTLSSDSVMLANCNALGGEVYRVSLYAKIISGTVTGIECRLGSLSDNNFILSPSTTNQWQRFDVLATPSSGTTQFNLNIRTTGAVVHLYQVNMTAGHLLYDPYTTGSANVENIANTVPVYRANDLGYCIEGLKTNLCKFSQNLANWSVIGGATISANPNPDAYNDPNTPTLVTFTAGQSVSLSQTLTVTEGETYNVSFYAVANSGGVESLSVQLGGGTVVTAEITTGYTRQSLLVVAGGTGLITFNSSASGSNSSFILTGVQVESGQLSTYIPTGSAAQTREADLVSFAGDNLPAYNAPFTARFAYSEVSAQGNNKTLLADDAGALLVEFNGSDLSFDGVIITGAAANSEAIFVYDGTTLTVYVDAVEVYAAAYTPSSAEVTTAYLGATDSAGSNALNAYLKSCDFWAFAMTQAEVEFISEVDHGNRNS